MVDVEAPVLTAFARELLAELGASDEHAETVAETLVASDLRGHASHGVLCIGMYADMIAHGLLDPNTPPVVKQEGPTTAVIDGQDTFGHVVGRTAVSTLVEKASEHGVAAVGVRDATHLGRIGEWAERATAADLLFAAFVNTQGAAQWVAPAGSAEKSLSTNPLAFGVPTFDALGYPIVLDMATSQVAHGKIRERYANDDPIPEGWTVDESGETVTDSAAFEEDHQGAIMPLGGQVSGYKGFGLALVAELFAGIVGNGAVIGQQEPDGPNNAAAFVAVDPLKFTTREAIEERITAVERHLGAASYPDAVSAGIGAKGEPPVFPGEPEHTTAEKRRREGIPLGDGIAAVLGDLAVKHGMEDAIPAGFPR